VNTMAEISEAGSVVLQAISEGTFWNDTPGAVTSRLQHAEAAKNWLRTHGLSGTIFSLPPKHPRNPNRSARGKTGGAWKGNLEEYMIRLTNKQGFHGYLDPTKILAELVGLVVVDQDWSQFKISGNNRATEPRHSAGQPPRSTPRPIPPQHPNCRKNFVLVCETNKKEDDGLIQRGLEWLASKTHMYKSEVTALLFSSLDKPASTLFSYNPTYFVPVRNIFLNFDKTQQCNYFGTDVAFLKGCIADFLTSHENLCEDAPFVLYLSLQLKIYIHQHQKHEGNDLAFLPDIVRPRIGEYMKNSRREIPEVLASALKPLMTMHLRLLEAWDQTILDPQWDVLIWLFFSLQPDHHLTRITPNWQAIYRTAVKTSRLQEVIQVLKEYPDIWLNQPDHSIRVFLMFLKMANSEQITLFQGLFEFMVIPSLRQSTEEEFIQFFQSLRECYPIEKRTVVLLGNACEMIRASSIHPSLDIEEMIFAPIVRSLMKNPVFRGNHEVFRVRYIQDYIIEHSQSLVLEMTFDRVLEFLPHLKDVGSQGLSTLERLLQTIPAHKWKDSHIDQTMSEIATLFEKFVPHLIPQNAFEDLTRPLKILFQKCPRSPRLIVLFLTFPFRIPSFTRILIQYKTDLSQTGEAIELDQEFDEEEYWSILLRPCIENVLSFIQDTGWNELFQEFSRVEHTYHPQWPNEIYEDFIGLVSSALIPENLSCSEMVAKLNQNTLVKNSDSLLSLSLFYRVGKALLSYYLKKSDPNPNDHRDVFQLALVSKELLNYGAQLPNQIEGYPSQLVKTAAQFTDKCAEIQKVVSQRLLLILSHEKQRVSVYDLEWNSLALFKEECVLNHDYRSKFGVKSTSSMDEALSWWKNQSRHYREHVALFERVRTWILRHKYSQSLNNPFQVSPTLSKKQIDIDLAAMKKSLGLDQSTLDCLTYFLQENSRFFEFVMNNQLQTKKKEIDDRHLTPKDLEQLIKECVNFLETMLDEQKLKLKYLQQVDELQSQYTETSGYQNEIGILENYFSRGVYAARGGGGVKNIRNLMSAGFQLIFFEKIRDQLVKFLQEYELWPEQLTQLQDPTFINVDVDTTVPEAQEHLVALHKLLGESFLKFNGEKNSTIFRTLVDGKDLLMLLHSHHKNFKTNENHLNNQVVGNPVLSVLLNSVSVMFRSNLVLQSLFRLLENKQSLSLSTFCSEITEGCAAFQSDFKLLNSRISEIRLLFDTTILVTAERIIPQVTYYMEQGQFESRLISDVRGTALVFLEAGQVVPETTIRDVIKGINIFLHKSSIMGDEKKLLEEFQKIHALANEIHQVRQDLEEQGYDEFQSSYLPELAKGLHLEWFERELSQSAQLLQQIKKMMKSAQKDQPRLSFMEAPVLGRFVGDFKTKIAAMDPPDMISALRPYIWICFPDFIHTKIRAAAEIDAQGFFTEACIVNAVKNACGVDGDDELTRWACVKEFIKLISAPLKSVSIPKSDCKIQVGELLEAATADDLFLASVAINQCPLHPSLVHNCSAKDTLGTIKRFIFLARSFPQFDFALSAVNNLPIEIRQSLLTKLLKFTSNKVPINLTLIFTDKVGVFSDLKKVSLHLDQGQIQEGLKPTKEAMAKKGIPFCRYLATSACSGKSHTIRELCKEEGIVYKRTDQQNSNLIQIQVNEDFSGKRLMETLKQHFNKPISRGTLGIHFDISPYAPLSTLNQILCHFVFGGLFVDESSGLSVSLPPDAQCHLYFELGLAPPKDPDFERYREPSAVLQALPIIKHFADPTKPTTQIPIDGKARLLASYVALYNKASIQDVIPPNLPPHKGTEPEVRDILNQFFHSTSSLPRKRPYLYPLPKASLHQAPFIDLMSKKFEDLDLVMNNRSLSCPTTYTFRYFEAFRDECAYLCRPGLDIALEAKTGIHPPLFSFIEELHDVLKPFPIISFIDFGSHQPLVKEFDTSIVKDLTSKEDQTAQSPWQSMTYLELSQKQCPDQMSLMRLLVANLFHCETEKMSDILAKEKFVLTPDLTLALIVLKNRLAIKRSVIWEGDTGVGKTELLRLFSMLLNFNTNHLPNILRELHQLLKHKIFKAMNPTATVLSKSLNDTLDSETHPNSNHGFANCIRTTIRAIAEAKDPAKLDVPSPGDRFLFPMVAYYLFKKTRQLFSNNRFPLIQRTPTLKQILDSQVQQPKAAQVLEDPDQLKNAPIASLDSLFVLVDELLNLNLPEFYERILMSQTKTVADINQFVTRLNERAQTHNVNIIGFIDESNTTKYLGIMKGLLCDHVLDGEQLHENLFFLAALNPERNEQEPGKVKIHKDDDEVGHFSGVERGSRLRPFTVRISPLSLRDRHVKFYDFSGSVEKRFLYLLLKTRASVFGLEGWEHTFPLIFDIIIESHDALREANQTNIHVSIRDINRCLCFFKHFYTDTGGQHLIAGMGRVIPQGHALFTRALTMALCLAYYFRFQDPNLRAALTVVFNQIFQSSGRAFQTYDFNTIVNDCLNSLFSQTTKISIEIAPTQTIKENLFGLVACIDAKIPFAIVGPAGSGKTLGFSIVSNHMTDDTVNVYIYLNQIVEWRYQVSLHSTDKEIRELFENAKARQFKLIEATPNCRQRCTILLDETSLNEGENLLLKETHDHLDHPEVSAVILSNEIMDVPNTNRVVLLAQQSLSIDDLQHLARCTLFGTASIAAEKRIGASSFNNTTNSEKEIRLAEALCVAFSEARCFTKTRKPNMFQQRDFIFFLRMLNEICPKPTGTLQGERKFTTEHVVHALRRHMNGVDITEFKEIVDCFISKLRDQPLLKPDFPKPSEAEVLQDKSLELILESLVQRAPPGKNPNTASFRYIMVMDPTETEAAVPLLLDLIKRNPVYNGKKIKDINVINVGDFKEDTRENSLQDVVLSVKAAMENGDTVLLLNSEKIRSAFYDLFNVHFKEVSTVSKGNGEVEIYYSAKLAIGSLSKDCIVHPDFKIIVHIPLSQIRTTQTPFLDRFEKYTLSIPQILSERLSHKNLWKSARISEVEDGQISYLEAVRSGVNDMVEKLHHKASNQHLLFGFHQDTVESLLLQAVERANERDCKIPQIMPSFRLNDGDAEDTLGNWGATKLISDEIRCLIQEANLKIFQLIRPEQMFPLYKSIPRSYKRELLCLQEHFNAIIFLQSLVSNPNPKRETSKKWCIYTRSTADLIQVESSEHSRTKLIEQLGVENRFVTILSLTNVSSSPECRNHIETFAKSFEHKEDEHHRVFLCFANMESTTTVQLNFFRHCVDSLVTQRNVFIVLVLHYPPELLLFAGNGELSNNGETGYRAIFLNNWDFMYIDSFDLRNVENTYRLKNRSHQVGTEETVDARSWLSFAFGLVDSFDLEAIQSSFEYVFLDLITQVRARLLISEKVLGPMEVSRKDLYDNPLFQIYQNNGGTQAFVEFIQQFPFLYKRTLFAFCQRWKDKLLREVILQVSKAIERGQPMNSLLRSVQYSLKFLFEPMVLRLLKALLCHFSIFSVQSTLLSPSKPLYEQYLSLALVAVVPPPKASILSIENLQQNEELINLDISRNYPPRLPLFDSLENELENCAMKVRSATPHRPDFTQLMETEIKTRPISQVLKLIDENDVLKQAFRDDLLSRTFSLKAIWEKHPLILREVLRVLAVDSLTAFCLVSTHEPFLGRLALLFGPVMEITDPDTISVQEFGKYAWSISHQGAAIDRIFIGVAAFNIEAIWNLLQKIMTDPECPISNIKQLIKSLALLANLDQIPSVLVDPPLNTKFLILITIYHFFLLKEMVKFDNLLAQIKGSHLLALIRQTKDEPIPYEGVPLRLATLMITEFQLGVEEQVQFCQDILGFTLRCDSETAKLRKIPDSLASNIRIFFLLCTNSDQIGAVPQPLSDILKRINSCWMCSQLSTLLQLKWRKQLLEMIDSIIMPTQQHRFQPCLFTAKDLTIKVSGKSIARFQQESHPESRFHQLLFQVFLYEQKEYSNDIVRLTTEFETHRQGQGACAQVSVSATCFHIIQFISRQLSCGTETPFNIIQTNILKEWRTLKSIEEVMKSQSIVSPPLTLLSLIQKQERLAALLSDGDAVKALDLGNFKVEAQNAPPELPIFEFMRSDRTPLGALYRWVSNIAQKPTCVTELIAEIEKNQISFQDFRLTLLCVLYYQHFNVAMKHQLFSEAFQNQRSPLSLALKLDREEVKVFAFFCNGPLPKVESINNADFIPLLCEGRETRNLSICHVMFNLLAVCLSMPADTTPFYDRILYPEKMPSHVPGSAHNHLNYDCGFRFLNGMLAPAKIMAGNILYRLSLNFCIWASLTWSGVFRQQGNHFSKVVALKERLSTCTKTATLQEHRTFIFSKAKTFFNALFQNLRFNQAGVFIPEYLTHAFLCLREDIVSLPPGTRRAYTNNFTSPEICTAWENTLMTHLAKAEKAHVGLVESFDKEQPSPDIIKEIRALFYQNLSFTPFVLRDLQDYVAFLPPAQGMREQKADYATHFFEYTKHIQILKYLKTFISIHQKIHKIFQLRIREDQKYLNFQEWLATVAHSETSQEIERLEFQWKQFKTDWQTVRKIIPELDTICRDIDDDKNPMCGFLYANDKNPGHILSAIEMMILAPNGVINAFLSTAQHLEDTPQKLLLGDANSRKSELGVDVLTIPFQGCSHLFSEQPSDETIEMFVASQASWKASVGSPLLFLQETLNYRINRINREIYQRLVSWSNLVAGSLKQKFTFAVRKNTEEPEQQSGNKLQIIVSSEVGTGPLKKEINILVRKVPKFKDFVHEPDCAYRGRLFETKIQTVQQSDKDTLLQLSSALISISRHIRKDPDFNQYDLPIPSEGIMLLATSLHQHELIQEYCDEIPVKYLVFISEILADRYDGMGFLFNCAGREEKLPDEVKEGLKQAERILASNRALLRETWGAVMHLLAYLRDGKISNRFASSKGHLPLMKTKVVKEYLTHRELLEPLLDWNQYPFLEKIELNHYAEFLRALNKLQVQLKHHLFCQQTHEEYSEKLPNICGVGQDLSIGSALKMPPKFKQPEPTETLEEPGEEEKLDDSFYEYEHQHLVESISGVQYFTDLNYDPGLSRLAHVRALQSGPMSIANSIFQCLAHLPPLWNSIDEQPVGHQTQLSEMLFSLLRNLWFGEDTEDLVSSTNLLDAYFRESERNGPTSISDFTTHVQGGDFLNKFLSFLNHEHEERGSNVTLPFRCSTRSAEYCPTCFNRPPEGPEAGISTTIEVIPVYLRSEVETSFFDSLFSQSPRTCQKCPDQVPLVFEKYFWVSPPSILALNLISDLQTDRWVHANPVLKIASHKVFPETRSVFQYEIVSIATQTGPNSSALCRSPHTMEWYQCLDQKVTEVPPSEVSELFSLSSTSSHIVFYARTDQLAENSDQDDAFQQYTDQAPFEHTPFVQDPSVPAQETTDDPYVPHSRNQQDSLTPTKSVIIDRGNPEIQAPISPNLPVHPDFSSQETLESQNQTQSAPSAEGPDFDPTQPINLHILYQGEPLVFEIQPEEELDIWYQELMETFEFSQLGIIGQSEPISNKEDLKTCIRTQSQQLELRSAPLPEAVTCQFGDHPQDIVFQPEVTFEEIREGAFQLFEIPEDLQKFMKLYGETAWTFTGESRIREILNTQDLWRCICYKPVITLEDYRTKIPKIPLKHLHDGNTIQVTDVPTLGELRKGVAELLGTEVAKVQLAKEFQGKKYLISPSFDLMPLDHPTVGKIDLLFVCWESALPEPVYPKILDTLLQSDIFVFLYELDRTGTPQGYFAWVPPQMVLSAAIEMILEIHSLPHVPVPLLKIGGKMILKNRWPKDQDIATIDPAIISLKYPKDESSSLTVSSLGRSTLGDSILSQSNQG